MGRGPVKSLGLPSLEVSVERLGVEGEGIASHQGRALFIPGAFPGERVRVTLEPAGSVLRAHLEEVLRPSSGRRSAPCALAERCGGCSWMHLEPSGQVLAKEGLVVDALERIGRIPPGSFKLLPTVGTGTDTGTRRRAVLHWAAKRLGFFGRRTHQAVAVDVCPALVATLAPLPGKLSAPLAPVGPALKAVHLLAEEGAVSLALELRGRIGPKSRQVAESLIRSGVVRGVVLVEPEGRTEEVGRPVLEAPAPQAPGVRLKLRADAFAQAHGQGAATLVERALGMLAPRPEDRALELYAGNGAFTFALASRLASVVAVESSPLSSALASSAARQSNVTNVRWVQGDASRVAEGLVKEGARFELLLADPPRTGAPALSRTARALGVRTVVYVGCDAGTLSRDAGRLVEAGFRLREVQLVDLFPNTHHVEVLLAFAA